MDEIMFTLMFLCMDEKTGRCELFCDNPSVWTYLTRTSGQDALLRRFQNASGGQQYKVVVTVYKHGSPSVTETRRLARGKGPIFTEKDRPILEKLCEGCLLEILEYQSSEARRIARLFAINDMRD